MDNWPEKKAFLEIAEKAKALEIPPPLFCYYEVETDDELIVAPSKSFVRNFYNMITHMSVFHRLGSSYGEGSTVAKNYWGGLASTSVLYRLYVYLGGYNSNNMEGIHVGTSNTAVTFEDYNLGSRISSGSSSGQLLYQAQTIEDVWYDSGIFYCKHRRNFNNYSGATITVREIGFYVWLASSSGDYCIVSRDVLPTAVDVANEKKLTVRYIFECPFPS